MPHKKNPDVFELVRARCNQIMALPNDIMMMTANLPSGYHRDLQLLKEMLFPAFQNLKDCLSMMNLMLSSVEVKEGILVDDKYKFLFSVEEVNKLVLSGVPFRDAYKQVGLEIQLGNYNPERNVTHSHEGSIGNLCNDEISQLMNNVITDFNFEKADQAISELIR